ncbi:hypothetical protein Ciccas_008261 [Cichlidogyrus casuarinus]|uniref:Uncharacterized protein n=1 Tax=Cichlidogyrus casuarinus TaxID=1844966 RepID=A0ABD2Q190_9PLAT
MGRVWYLVTATTMCATPPADPRPAVATAMDSPSVDYASHPGAVSAANVATAASATSSIDYQYTSY